MRADNLKRALELDDDLPAAVCPGCEKASHDYEVPWCMWNRDYLMARAFRRAYISQHFKVGS